MYGTIFSLKIKPGHEEALLTTLKEQQDTPEGSVAWFVMKPDIKEEWIGVAVFKDKESHISNSNRPEQHQTFLKIMEHLESDHEWTDGTYVIGEIA